MARTFTVDGGSLLYHISLPVALLLSISNA